MNAPRSIQMLAAVALFGAPLAAQNPITTPIDKARGAATTANAQTAATNAQATAALQQPVQGTTPPAGAAGRGAAAAPAPVTQGTPAQSPAQGRGGAAGTAAQPAAGAAQAPAQAPGGATPRPASDSMALSREFFQYSAQGRRDPFVSLVATGELRPFFNDLQLTAVMYRPGASVAVLRDNGDGGKSKSVKVGDTLGRMRVIRITPNGITFEIREYGTPRQESLVLSDTTSKR